MAQYQLIAVLKGAEVNGEQIKDATLHSDIFDNKELAEDAQQAMLTNWGVHCELTPYDSEHMDDGYDYDKYN